MITLWGRLNSINVQKVAWCLEEIGLDYHRIDAGGPFGVSDTPDYLAINPTGLVPTFEEDGFVLWESNAIVRYLAARHGRASLWPEDARPRAEADRWMDWQATAFSPAMRDAFWQVVRTSPERQDPALIARSVLASERMAEILERHLAARTSMAGQDFSIADIAVGAAAHRWLNLPLERQPRPALEGWYAGLMQRPAARLILTLPIT